PNDATRLPPESMTMMLDGAPLCTPFCETDDVADGAPKPVTAALPSSPTMFHVKVDGSAPLTQAGVLISTLSAAAPFTWASRPCGSNESVPVASSNGVPGVPPVTSAPGTVIV